MITLYKANRFSSSLHAKYSSVCWTEPWSVCLSHERQTYARDCLCPSLPSPRHHSVFSCYETGRRKPRPPQFIIKGTKAKAVDKAVQTNPNQLPLNTHITLHSGLSDRLTYKRPIQGLTSVLLKINMLNNYNSALISKPYKSSHHLFRTVKYDGFKINYFRNYTVQKNRTISFRIQSVPYVILL